MGGNLGDSGGWSVWVGFRVAAVSGEFIDSGDVVVREMAVVPFAVVIIAQVAVDAELTLGAGACVCEVGAPI